jgi:DNA-nicking Smr family endonuclease
MAHRSRPLHHGEIALWREVTKTIRPLSAKPIDPQSDPAMLNQDDASAAQRPVGLEASVGATDLVPKMQKAAPKPAALKPLAPIERPLLRKISRGQSEIDAVLDLHGLRQHEAHERLRRFLHQCQFNHARVVLVVTGKGNSPRIHAGSEHEGHGKGVLRRLVPDWLRMPDLRSVVMGFEEAAPHQGGSGALYVRLRKRKNESSFE